MPFGDRGAMNIKCAMPTLPTPPLPGAIISRRTEEQSNGWDKVRICISLVFVNPDNESTVTVSISSPSTTGGHDNFIDVI